MVFHISFVRNNFSFKSLSDRKSRLVKHRLHVLEKKKISSQVTFIMISVLLQKISIYSEEEDNLLRWCRIRNINDIYD